MGSKKQASTSKQSRPLAYTGTVTGRGFRETVATVSKTERDKKVKALLSRAVNALPNGKGTVKATLGSKAI